MRRCLLCHELQEEYNFVSLSKTEAIRSLVFAFWKLNGKIFTEPPSVLLGKQGRICRGHLSEACNWLAGKSQSNNSVDNDFYNTLVKCATDMKIPVPQRYTIYNSYIKLKSQSSETTLPEDTDNNNVDSDTTIVYRKVEEEDVVDRKQLIKIPTRYINAQIPTMRPKQLLSFTTVKTVSFHSEPPKVTNVAPPIVTYSSFESTASSQVIHKEHSEWEKSTSPEIAATNDNLNKFYIVKGNNLLRLCHSCPSCSRYVDSSQVSLSSVGTAPVILVRCNNCWRTHQPEQKWYGQDRVNEDVNGFEINFKIVGAAVTTGLRWQMMSNFFNELKVANISRALYYRYLKPVLKAVDTVYDENREYWLAKVEEAYKGCKNWEVAADGAYDSRIYSAKIGKTVLADQRTNLIISLHTMHCQKVDYKSGRMEIAGLRELIEELNNRNVTIKSITTDRSRSFGKLIRDLNEEFGMTMEHKYDAWHLVKWLGNKLREAAKGRDCGILAAWTQKIKTHLWYSIAYEDYTDREEARQSFNSCLHHLCGEHSWELEELTGEFTDCSHGPSAVQEEFLKKGSKAETALKKIVLTKSFQTDIAKANIIGTSVIECKNFLDGKYVRKETFTPIHTYISYAKLAALHLNQLTLSEFNGTRTVIKERTIQRKFLMRKSLLRVKSPVGHPWRAEIIRISGLLRSGVDPSGQVQIADDHDSSEEEALSDFDDSEFESSDSEYESSDSE